MMPISAHLHRSFNFITVLYRGTLEVESVGTGEYAYYSWERYGNGWKEYVNSYAYFLNELIHFVKNALEQYKLDFETYSRIKKYRFYRDASDLHDKTWAVNLALLAFCYLIALVILTTH